MNELCYLIRINYLNQRSELTWYECNNNSVALNFNTSTEYTD